MEEPYHWGTFNIGSGYPVSFGQIGRKMAEKYNVPIEWIPMPGAIRRHYQEWTIADTTKMRQNLADPYGGEIPEDGRKHFLLNPLEYIDLKL